MDKQSDFLELVNKFIDESGNDINHRYRSFDFCYAHFHPDNKNQRDDVEKGCYILWGYLASWGMLRGSSFLLGKNPAYLKDTVEFILAQNKSVWEIEPDGYAEHFEIIKNSLYKNIKAKLINDEEIQKIKGKKKQIKHRTLVTKVLLGVFGIVPAYDEYFCNTFRNISKQDKDNKKHCGFRALNKDSLNIITLFYNKHKQEIEALQNKAYIIDFEGNKTELQYTSAKIIDMYGFQKGMDNVPANQQNE